MVYKILIASIPRHNAYGKVTGKIETASVDIFPKGDKEAFVEGRELYKTPCLVFNEFDQKDSEICGVCVTKPIAQMQLEEGKSTDRLIEFFKKHGDDVSCKITRRLR